VCGVEVGRERLAGHYEQTLGCLGGRLPLVRGRDRKTFQ